MGSSSKTRRIGRIFLKVVGVLLILFLFSRVVIPTPKFNKPTSTVLEDSSGVLIGARIATDGQWRFPPGVSVPGKFQICLINFEDRYFNYHFGINPVSIFRALVTNIKEGKIIQGGSTITMQVARMVRGNQSRNFFQKIIELLITLHLEINFSKEEILELYAANAPFGGNVVGLETASWRYYGRTANQLSWSETATLAVLPNAPSLIYPGKNHELLKIKRDKLLDKLKSLEHIDDETCHLAKLEELPGHPLPLPNFAMHALDRVNEATPGTRFKCSLNAKLQKRIQKRVNEYIEEYSTNGVNNGAAIVLRVTDGRIIAYIGNSTNSNDHANMVDIIKAPRSTGSVLKPFLYCSMLSEGELLPGMLIPDIPTHIAGYSPKNFYLKFDGAVFANEALYRSLNVPFVKLLQRYKVDRFYNKLIQIGMTGLVYPSDHYGLSLILGGGEGKLIDMSSMFAGLARRLLDYNSSGPSGNKQFYTSSISNNQVTYKINEASFTPAAIFKTFEALEEANRPSAEEGWKSFKSSRRIAWKTGTSFGNKDAWAIGVTPEYVVGIWIGNADGEGRAGLTGLSNAAPVMFDIYEMLPKSSWFETPYDDFDEVIICNQSGYRASNNCDQLDTTNVPSVGNKTMACPYHFKVHLSSDEKYQVNMSCEDEDNIIHKSWFILPPVQEWYYKSKSPLYQTVPPFKKGCNNQDQKVMEFVYPRNTSKVYIPKELSGELGRVVFEIAHRNSGKKIFWHLDTEYLGFTQDIHQMEFYLNKGKHLMIAVDIDGNEIVKRFEVLSE